MNNLISILLVTFLLSSFIHFANTDQWQSKRYTKIGLYSAKVDGVYHLLQLENDSVFNLSVYPKKWLSCWSIRDYSGTYTLEKDTLRFIFQPKRPTNESNETEIIQETFVVKRNKNIYRIGTGKVLFAKYRFSWRRYRSIEIW